MTSKKIAIMMVLIIVMLCGCRKVKNDKSNNEYPICKDNEIYLYHIYENKIISYDTKKKEMRSKINSDSWMQYNFSPFDNNYYTSGDSFENGFEVIEIENDNKIKKIYKLENNEGIFPFVEYKGEKIYMHCYYDKDNKEILEKRKFVTINNGNINELDYIEHAADKGTIHNDKLYYTEYIRSKDKYNLYVLDMNNNNAGAVLLKDDMEYGDILATKYGVMYRKDDEFVYLDNEDKQIPVRSESFSNDMSKYIYQIGVNNDANLEFTVTDADNGEVVWKEENIISFKVIDNKVTVYGRGYIKSKELT